MIWKLPKYCLTQESLVNSMLMSRACYVWQIGYDITIKFVSINWFSGTVHAIARVK